MGKQIEHVAASVATETTTGVQGGLDVDVTVTIDGVDHEGEVTLVPDAINGGHCAYGPSADYWVSGGLLKVLQDSFEGASFREALSKIESAATAECG
jgi:hypothetical protein